MAKTGVTVVLDRVQEVIKGIDLLASQRVMVGIPADKAARKDGSPISNAALLYIHDHGAPEVNIPARESLKPGVENVKGEIGDGLKKAGEFALDGRPDAVDRQFHRVGAIGRDAVKLKIGTGPFVPLKPSTIAKRRRRSKGSKYRRKAVTAADTTPLIDTAQMRNAVNYVLRKVK